MPFSTQSITTAATNIAIPFTECESATFANTHDSDDITVDLWLSGTASTDVVTTGVLINATADYVGYPIGHTSTIVTDTVAATAAVLLNERVYKSDGTFVGKCTAVNSTTTITIGGGTETELTDDDALFVGNRYYTLNDVEIPHGSSLKLDGNEINFDTDNYVLLLTCSDVGIDITFRD